MRKAAGLVFASFLFTAWAGDVSAEVQCVGCACKMVVEETPCGVDPGEQGATGTSSTTASLSHEGSFVCWLNGEQPDSAELAAICGGHCAALPTPPPSPCVDNKQTIIRYVTEQRVGPCDSSCPPDESAACTDGINNDAFLDEATDCADEDCASDPACRAMAPTASPLGLGLVLAVLFVLGSLRLSRATTSS